MLNWWMCLLKNCITFYTSNTIITVISEINANEPLQNKMKTYNKVGLIKFSCYLRGSKWTWVLGSQCHLVFSPKERDSVCQSPGCSLLPFLLVACLYSPGFPNSPSMQILTYMCTEENYSKWQLTTTAASWKDYCRKSRTPYIIRQFHIRPGCLDHSSLFQSTVT